MKKRNVKIPTIFHSIDDVNLSEYTYNRVYASETTSPTINGNEITIPKGAFYDIRVSSISGSDIYLLGYPISPAAGLSYSGYSQEMLGGSAFLSGGTSSGSGSTSDVIGQAIIGQAIIG